MLKMWVENDEMRFCSFYKYNAQAEKIEKLTAELATAKATKTSQKRTKATEQGAENELYLQRMCYRFMAICEWI